MRRISVPPSLLPLQLAEFEELSPALRKQLIIAAPVNPRALAFDEALTAAENALTVVRHQRDRYSEALLALYSADLLWRCERWLEALEMAAAAAGWFKLQSSPIARYNEAVAVYFNGLLHFALHADARAMPLFIEAQSQLEKSRQYWAAHTGRAYFEVCEQVNQWISALSSLRTQTPPGSQALIIPVYPSHPHTPEAPLEALAIPLEALRIRPNILPLSLRPLDNWTPLEIESLPVLDVSPGRYYFGVRLDEAGTFTDDSLAGDVVLVEALSPLALTEEPPLTGGTQPFIRQRDGKVMLRDPQHSGEGLVGIPRLLLRQGWRG